MSTMNGPTATYAWRAKRGGAIAASGALLCLARELNGQRPPDHRERMSRAVALTEDYFRRGPESALPAQGADALLDAVRELDRACEGSRSGYEEACADLERLQRLE